MHASLYRVEQMFRWENVQSTSSDQINCCTILLTRMNSFSEFVSIDQVMSRTVVHHQYHLAGALFWGPVLGPSFGASRSRILEPRGPRSQKSYSYIFGTFLIHDPQPGHLPYTVA